MIMAVAQELTLVHAQAMDQHQQLTAGARDGLGECLPFEDQRLPPMSQFERDRQRVAAGQQVIAEHAVDDRERVVAPQRRRQVAGQRFAGGQQRVEHHTHQIGDPAHTAIDQTGDPGGARARRCRQTGHARDVPMHRLDHIGHPAGGLECEPRRAAQVADAVAPAGTLTGRALHIWKASHSTSPSPT